MPITRAVKSRSYHEEPGDVYVGRYDSAYGNPYVIGRDGTRDDVIAKFREYLVSNHHLVEALRAEHPVRLVCHCLKSQKCHADVWLEYLNAV